jgi:hypothetical protein
MDHMEAITSDHEILKQRLNNLETKLRKLGEIESNFSRRLDQLR